MRTGIVTTGYEHNARCVCLSLGEDGREGLFWGHPFHTGRIIRRSDDDKVVVGKAPPVQPGSVLHIGNLLRGRVDGQDITVTFLCDFNGFPGSLRCDQEFGVILLLKLRFQIVEEPRIVETRCGCKEYFSFWPDGSWWNCGRNSGRIASLTGGRGHGRSATPRLGRCAAGKGCKANNQESKDYENADLLLQCHRRSG